MRDLVVIFTSHSAVEASIVRGLLEARKTMIVSGGTGTGKTTLLRARLAEVADDERLRDEAR